MVPMKKEDIEQLALLARIEVGDAEALTLAHDITKILEYVSEVNEITGDTHEKTVGALYNVMREDTDAHEPGIYTEDILSAAPGRDGQYIKVKKILDNNDT